MRKIAVPDAATMNQALFMLLLTFWSCNVAAAPSGNDLPRIEALQRRADGLAKDGLQQYDYHLTKARTWLDLAMTEFYDEDDSGVILAATEQAEGLIDAVANRQINIPLDTPRLITGTEEVRPDLWERIAALKMNENFSCGQRPTAQAEVYLVWSGHEYYESGQSHAASYMRAVEDRIYEAQVAMNNCMVPAAPAPLMERITLSSDALFAFNSATLSVTAMSDLGALIEKISKVDSLEEVILVGHTDRLRSDGHPERNQMLSEQRAESIKQFLIDKGLAADKIHTSGAGSTQPVVECSSKLSKDELIVCLQPNRRVEITLRGGSAVNENKGFVK